MQDKLSVKEVDDFLVEGIAHYTEAMYAIRQFERLIDETALNFAERRMVDLLQLFGQEKLDGGGHVLYGPDIIDVSNTVPKKWWSWIGREYWIKTGKGCSLFIGMLINEGKFSASVNFMPQRAHLRDWLLEVLNRRRPGTAMLNENWEIIVSLALENESVSVQDFSDAMDQVLDQVIAAIEEAGGWPEKDADSGN